MPVRVGWDFGLSRISVKPDPIECGGLPSDARDVHKSTIVSRENSEITIDWVGFSSG